MNFKQKFENIVKENNSLLCVGLDPEISKIPKHLLRKKLPIFEFNKAIIDHTYDLVCTYKPNIAFYEAYGTEGLLSLRETINYLHENYSHVPIILDAKRGDIGNTAKMYAKAIFEYWKADAVTIYPYLGLDSTFPFFEYQDKLIILLIKTSNPDSPMFQNLRIGNEPFYIKMSKIISKWSFKNLGIFVGATYPNELKKVRQIFPNTPFLIAGLGAQKGEVERAVKAGVDRDGKNLICNSSRSIIYASNARDFAQKAREKALEVKNTINKYR